MITHHEGQTRSLCRGFFRAGTVSTRRSRIKRTASGRRDEGMQRANVLDCTLHRIMVPIRPMLETLTVTRGSLPIGAFPLLEGIFPPGSSDSETRVG
jgi:hypothetical protein